MIVTGIKGRLVVMITISVITLILSQELIAQEPPPRPVEVTILQNMAFGAFSQGATGGSVTVNTDGSRVATGDVVLLNLGFSFNAASFKLVANEGTLISLVFGSDVSLPGSNGGSMNLHLEGSDPASPFVISVNPPASTTLYISGTLSVGNSSSSPPGSYSGTFDITFIQE
ncbi:MAG TPA: DUF4402 domain-containing protein [Bacteroidales bacterium]|nr:DUF4402 domain-containing protein [Bacteroidales bacterium]